jgi:hypothetical protein
MGEMVESKTSDKNTNKGMEGKEEDWRTVLVRESFLFLKSLEDLAYCFRLEAMYISGSTEVNDHTIESPDYQKRKGNSYRSFPFLLTFALTVLFMTSQTTMFGSSLLAFLSMMVLTTSALHYILFTKQDGVLLAKVVRHRDMNCSDTDDDSDDTNGQAGSGGSDNSRCSSDAEEDATMKCQSRDLVTRVTSKLDEILDRCANMMFGGFGGKTTESGFGGKIPQFCASGFGGKVGGSGFGGKMLLSGFGG